ncbi:phosphomannomutase/phosphoglucomutase [Alkanindiges illinoisensis]|uniref:phosphomannomutase/phosphoglucomutase n=1 Tax=Alkanindiges illinoisensis TaxID=197183 RepID=UPI000A05C321|nr:phosphomannomutase/phosphoglucomutase [Alkanindiges illinoisensis]
MPKLKPLNTNKGLTINKPLALIIHFVLMGASSAGVYYLVAQHDQQQTQAQLDTFTKQAGVLIEHYAQHWQQQAGLLAQQPMLRSSATLKAVIPIDGSVPPSLNYADQDLLNRTRSAPTQPEISGTGAKGVVSTARAMPTGGYAIFEWPLAPLVKDLESITPANIELKFSQKLSDGSQLEVLRIHGSGNDGGLKAIPLNQQSWQLAVQSVDSGSQLPLWAALLTLLGGLIPLAIWALRKSPVADTAGVADPNLDNLNTSSATDFTAINPAATSAYNNNVAISPISAAAVAEHMNSSTVLEDDAVMDAAPTSDETTSTSPVAQEASASEAFEELDLLEETLQESPADTAKAAHSDAIEFNLDETLLPDMEFNVGAPRFPDHIFRAYDIRGTIDDLSNELVTKIGRALGAHYRYKNQYQVVVGYDARTSSSGYARLIRQAFVDSGLTVIDIGRVTTPICYFAAAQHDGNAVMITASHNPANENGLKWLVQHQSPTPDNIEGIKQCVLDEHFIEGLGTIRSVSYNEDYLNLLQDDVILSQPFNISVDAMHGSAGEFAMAAFQAAGCEVSSLHTEANGMFPNGAPDPSKAEYLQELSNDIVISGSQLGFAFDGDGDRVVVLDSQGNVVSPDHLITLFAKICLDSNPGSDIIFDVKCSRMVSSIVSQDGGRPVMVRTGNTFLRQALNDPEHQAVFAGEFSGHYFFKDHRGHGQDDGLYAALRLLEWLDNSGQTLEEVIASLPQRVSTPDLYLPLDNTDATDLMTAFEAEAAQLSDAKISTIDGIRLDFDAGFGIIRPSNTGHFITARFDADTAENLRLIRATFARLLRSKDERLAQLILE